MDRAPDNNPGGSPDRLTPTMASFRLLVLAFVREYIGLTGHSPSYGEIAAKLNSNRTRVRKAVKSLSEEGLLLRTPGPRGLTLPSMRQEAIRQLRQLGWQIDEDNLHAEPGVTNRALLPPAALTYPSQDTGKEGANGCCTDSGRDGAGAARAARGDP